MKTKNLPRHTRGANREIPFTHSRCKTGMFHFSLKDRDKIQGGIITIFILILLTCSRILGGTNYVSLTGSHTSPFDTWAKAANDIQSAVIAADPDNVVLVKGGTYSLVSPVGINKNLTLKSTDGAATTIIDGGNAVICIIVGAGNIVIDGFTITKGKSPGNGGGLQILGGYAEVLNCVVSDNSAASGFGGGIGSLIFGTISNCVVSGNTAVMGGGMAFYIDCTVIDCIITNNIATGATESFGGGVLGLVGGHYKRCTIVNNKSFYGGGGIGILMGGIIEDCIIKGNTAVLMGGGVYFDRDGLIMKSTVTGNNSVIAAGIYCENNSTVRECYVSGCTATSKAGGIYCGTSSKVINSVIYGNSAGTGGGVYSDKSSVENCTIVDNSASVNGEGLYSRDGSNINSIIYFNNSLAGENIHNVGAVYYSHCCSIPVMAGEGNTDIDPDFADYAAGDFQLSIGSPCIDTGTDLSWMSGTKDIAGNDRIMGETVDMGAYEYPLFRAKSAEWRYKSKKNKGTIKGKYISPSFTNYFNDGWQIGMKNGETGALIDGPRELVPNKKNKVWKFKEKKQAQIIYKAKKDMLVYKVWASIPPTNIIFLVQTNAPGVIFSDSQKTTRKEIEFYLYPAYPEKTDGWRRLVPKAVGSEQ